MLIVCVIKMCVMCLCESYHIYTQSGRFGHPIANFQGMMFQYADAAVEIQAARLLVYEAARLQEGLCYLFFFLFAM